MDDFIGWLKYLYLGGNRCVVVFLKNEIEIVWIILINKIIFVSRNGWLVMIVF